MSDIVPEKPRVVETEIESTRFGTVTNLMVHYNVKKGLFSGTRREDLIMRHVVAARLETSRHVILGALFGLIGLVWFLAAVSGGSATFLIALLLLALGIFFFWGFPKVAVTAADGVARPSVSWPWTRAEANTFVNAVSRQLLERG